GDLHSLLGITPAGGSQHALAFNLHHAGTAVAVRTHSLHVAKARNLDAVLLSGFQDCLAGTAHHRFSVQAERDSCRRQEDILLMHYLTSPGKNFKTVNTGFGAAWPSPQMDASIIACESSWSSGASQRLSSINWSALTVPTRQGVHWPQDSSAKNFIRLRAAADAVSCFESTTLAADPMKQPYSFKVSKSRGTLAIDAGRIPPEAPPGRYAYSSWPSSIPPQYSSMSSRSVMPAGARWTPGFFTRPLTE